MLHKRWFKRDTKNFKIIIGAMCSTLHVEYTFWRKYGFNTRILEMIIFLVVWTDPAAATPVCRRVFYSERFV